MIRMRRTTSYADGLRAYRIVVNGQEVARVSPGQSVDIPVRPGTHSVVAKIDWCSSPTLTCSVKPGEVAHFECGNNLRGFRIVSALFYAVFLRDQYLTLTQL